ncbi:class I SAM-dependent methyltransferase [Polymorphobacter fuscus]|nr:class I SAM-dependent methyltransferase [Polymorphobacter fuscus]NJC07604.1 ubiquinone/menaquinone biosynthesis C-methylase UbiE [Polymorphobacter fuscus]
MSNADQIEYWNSKVGDTWARMQDRLDRAFTPVTVALLSVAAPQPGEDVLDVGCGSGETTLALAGAVGEDGSALGIDVSESLLAKARERAEELLVEADFLAADAATYDDAGFDLILSRFGVMFFADPVAAFANLRQLAAPGGRLCFACWQSPSENLWAKLPMQALAGLLPNVPAVDPNTPGPFAFAEPEHVHAILSAAGWQDIAFDDLPFSMLVGDGDDPVAAAVNFNLRIGPAARAVRDAGAAAEAAAPGLLAAALSPYRTEDGVGLPAAVWLVSARA